jgi:glutamine synthetase
MTHYTREDILKLVDEEDVEFIRLQFTDIFGTLKNVAITRNNLERALDNKYMFDGSAIEGFVRGEESDMFLYPDFDTFTIFPWRPQQGKVARLICTVHTTDGQPLANDPRNVLKRVLKTAEEKGYQFNVGPECEFYLFHTDELGRPTTITHEEAGYFDLGPVDLGENVRRDIVLTLEDMDFEIESSQHEEGRAQHEIDFKYDEGLRTADNIMTFKLAVKTIAKRHGLYATFMPKPVNGENTSGMHINISLSQNGENVFYDGTDAFGLSDTAYQFMAGILKHIKGISLITNPLINSYKRLANGKSAPVEIGWSDKGRKPLIRVPFADKGSTRIELRSPDPTCNPYLALALCLAAGLEGIEQKLDAAPYCSASGGNKTLDRLPQNLGEAIQEFEQDALIQKVLGEELSSKILEAKKAEWKEYSFAVTDWELDRYLARY